jgi:hypothetical protein
MSTPTTRDISGNDVNLGAVPKFLEKFDKDLRTVAAGGKFGVSPAELQNIKEIPARQVISMLSNAAADPKCGQMATLLRTELLQSVLNVETEEIDKLNKANALLTKQGDVLEGSINILMKKMGSVEKRVGVKTDGKANAFDERLSKTVNQQHMEMEDLRGELMRNLLAREDLQKKIADKEKCIGDLGTKITGLEKRVTDLGVELEASIKRTQDLLKATRPSDDLRFALGTPFDKEGYDRRQKLLESLEQDD